tara:strand:+ start:20364 stop:20654 length:291 start_codon:yes stop_codon:yes gene_type:complete
VGILIRPIVTEKASSASELENRYSFEVKTGANKVEIKKAVEDFYGVTVKKVRTLNYKPKYKTKYTKTGVQFSKTNLVKKAIVSVSEGDTIDFYENQ